ncbi:copper chaperone PCu(A)C [Candidatus Rhodoluna planktonica]|uniref:Copper chaperone PCu(A)C n=1 Tax=Candidatus Rhodoluna planktonica TaxID=535712 RepID=A0A1D9DXU6_9MICO|nr:copper chaperone PCu(A)C [Candidatus Rhodoluna planktonica]AOY55626.1 hypothetical protein A4Z71_01035 [Candidatus Rhodoluna planktonica]
MKKFALFAAASALVLAASGCSAATEAHPEEMHADNGWVRAYEMTAMPGGMTGAFAEITNHTNADVTLVGASSSIANMVEVHEVVSVDGEMKMRPKEGGIVIPAGETVTLEPGGLHIMLMDTTAAILEGDEITLTLDFDGAEDLTVTWPAKSAAAGDEEYQSK